ARPDLCGGWSVMTIPTATSTLYIYGVIFLSIECCYLVFILYCGKIGAWYDGCEVYLLYHCFSWWRYVHPIIVLAI
ncbi:MAG: hypothetical protein ACTH59_16275, partial [Pseudoalteromonas nigrifaciens]|uniref:hypothetical protein n=1 Tax=Pseudoalteromonas nigrifaciens TaxID=28109 RepID=UPI003F9D0398